MTTKNFYSELILFCLYMMFIVLTRILTLPNVVREKLDDNSIIETIDTTPLLNNNKFAFIIGIIFIFVIFRIILLQHNNSNITVLLYLQLSLVSVFIFVIIGAITVLIIECFQIQGYSILIRRLICGFSLFIYFYFLNKNVFQIPDINNAPLLFKNLTHCFSIFILGILIDIYFIWFLMVFLIGSMVPVKIYSEIEKYFTNIKNYKNHTYFWMFGFMILGIVLTIIYQTNPAYATSRIGPWILPGITTWIAADQHFFGGRLTGANSSFREPVPIKIINRYDSNGVLEKSTKLYNTNPHSKQSSYTLIENNKKGGSFGAEESKSNKSKQTK